MNERILSPQLLKLVQAAGPGYSQANPEWVKKFAELIVRECAGIYDKIDNGNLHMGTDDYLEALHKTFFGVKE